MLTIGKLSVTCRSDLRCILSDFSLQLGPGERAALIGEEGDGKSTLLRLIHAPALAEAYVEWSGAVSPGGRTGYLPQELSPAELDAPARRLFDASRGFGRLTPRERAALAGDYYVLGGEMPSVLVECGFLSNPTEEALLLDPAYQQKIGQAIADGLEDYVELLSRTGQEDAA